MNTARRKTIQSELEIIKNAIISLEDVLSKEQDCLDSYPENLQNSERYEESCDLCDDFEDALSNLTDSVNEMEEIYS